MLVDVTTLWVQTMNRKIDGRENMSRTINHKDIRGSGVPWQSLLGKFSYTFHTSVPFPKHPLSVTLFFLCFNCFIVLNIILQSCQRCEDAAMKPSRNVSQAHRGLNDIRVC